MKKILSTICALCFVLTAGSCNGNTDEPAVETTVAETTGFTVTIDPEWEVCEVPGPLTGVVDKVSKNSMVLFKYTIMYDENDYPVFCSGDRVRVEFEALYKTADGEYIAIPASIEAAPYEAAVRKPVIYLYPEEKTDVSVRLDCKGGLLFTYPDYGDGWNVTAMPDGTLYDDSGNEYSYLFWEGNSSTEYDFSEGFCVKGEDTVEFLRESLSLLGLTPREYNEFIVYWLPFMQDNEYNVISFQNERYTENAVLDVSPAPDTVLRVFMAFYPSDEYVEIPEQQLTTTERKGFTLVEWGGTECSSEIK